MDLLFWGIPRIIFEYACGEVVDFIKGRKYQLIVDKYPNGVIRRCFKETLLRLKTPMGREIPPTAELSKNNTSSKIEVESTRMLKNAEITKKSHLLISDIDTKVLNEYISEIFKTKITKTKRGGIHKIEKKEKRDNDIFDYDFIPSFVFDVTSSLRELFDDSIFALENVEDGYSIYRGWDGIQDLDFKNKYLAKTPFQYGMMYQFLLDGNMKHNSRESLGKLELKEFMDKFDRMKKRVFDPDWKYRWKREQWNKNLPDISYECDCGRKEECHYCDTDYCGKLYGRDVYDSDEGEYVNWCGYCYR